jgi:hypothetical protein
MERSGPGVRWVETLIVWGLVAIGGVGLWASAAGSLFGGPEADQAALTLFAFFVALGLAATVTIWCFPGVWHRWMHRMPPDDGGRLDAGKMVFDILFWVLGLGTIVGMVAAGWHAVAVSAAIGTLLVGRLFADLWLHHRLGRRGAPDPWRSLADAGRKLDAIQAYRIETGAGLADAKESVETYMRSREDGRG